jgi:hypothetical protein
VSLLTTSQLLCHVLFVLLNRELASIVSAKSFSLAAVADGVSRMPQLTMVFAGQSNAAAACRGRILTLQYLTRVKKLTTLMPFWQH